MLLIFFSIGGTGRSNTSGMSSGAERGDLLDFFFVEEDFVLSGLADIVSVGAAAAGMVTAAVVSVAGCFSFGDMAFMALPSFLPANNMMRYIMARRAMNDRDAMWRRVFDFMAARSMAQIYRILLYFATCGLSVFRRLLPTVYHKVSCTASGEGTLRIMVLRIVHPWVPLRSDTVSGPITL